MPKIKVNNQIIQCESGQNLRRVLIANGMSPHNGFSNWLNCKGLGTCGTCAVEILNYDEALSFREMLRLSFPPHKTDDGLRLACQTVVNGDMELKKHDGFWGSRKSTSGSSEP